MSDIFYRHRHLLQVGDKVRVCFDPELMISEDKRLPIGATGEIVGFALNSVCRTATFTEEPAGMYLAPEWPFVRFGTAVIRNMRANALEMMDKAEYARRLELSLSENPHTSLRGSFVSDLPDTKFYEGDIVRPKPNYGRGKNDKPKQLKKYGLIPGLPDAYMVTYICFHAPGKIIESLDEYPSFSIGDRFLRSAKDGFLDYDLELVERGNFWRRAHGEPLVFKDLAEESFWAWMVGEVECVPAPPIPREPWERDYSSGWSPALQKEEAAKWYNKGAALACVQAGNGHGVQTHSTFADVHGSDMYVRHNVLRFKNEDLGRRVAEATLNGFLVPSKEWDNDYKENEKD